MSNLTPLEKVVKKAICFDRDKKYQDAAKILSKGLELCECQFLKTPASLPPTSRSPNPRVPCTCRDFVNAALEGTVLAISKQLCSCPARKWKKCESRTHHQALSLQVSMLVKVRQLDQALASIGHLLELSPSHPEAYLRLGQTLRLQNPGDNEKAEQALKAYTTGLKVAKRGTASEFATQYEALKKMREKLSALFHHQRRNDPVTKFPPEILEMIFKDFTLAEMSQMTRVSKNWKRCLTSEPRLWRTLCFTSSNKKEAGLPALKDICRRSNFSARSLILENTRWTVTDPSLRKLREVLRLSPDLKSLRINEARPRKPLGYVSPAPGIFTNIPLKKLVAVYFGPKTPVGLSFLEELIAATAGAIECLTMLDAGESLFSLNRRLLPASLPLWAAEMKNLKYLRIAQPHSPVPQFNALPLAEATPNLKQFVLDGEREILFLPPRGRIPADPPGKLWQNLEVLKASTTSGQIPIHESILDPSKLIHFDPGCPLSNAHGPLKRLKHYHMAASMESGLGELVQSVLSCESLEYFGVSSQQFSDRPSITGPSYIFSTDFLPLFEDASHIKGFGMRLDYVYEFTEESAQRFLTLLRKFPQLESVAIEAESEIQPSQVYIFLGLLRNLVELGVKRIHENCLTGVLRDEFYAYARDHGVQVFRISAESNLAEIPINYLRDWTKPFMKTKTYKYTC